MNSLPIPRPSDHWLLKVTIGAARTGDTYWSEQLAVLRSVASCNPASQTCCTLMGAVDLEGLRTLQALFDAARLFGTDIQLEPSPVSTAWQGPTFTCDGQISALPAAYFGQGRPLGQLLS
ncbi:hypothetical protein ACFVYD_29705 [Streptomyces sp. NPDC058301]|uniref:hypothetical protein n=1 Tax=Streptomyces sp. NPDC058301 TaxID=3346436 RepID=UPI0036EC95A0